MRASKKSLFKAIAFVLPFTSLLVCVNKESDYLEASEANLRVILAFQIKDEMCQETRHEVKQLVFAPTREDSVNTCVLAVLDTACSAWVKEDPTPLACKGLVFDTTI